MKFLRRLWTISGGSSDRGGRGDPNDGNTPLARYIFSSRHFAKTKNKVKPGAFLPNRDRELSVFRTDGLTPPEIWRLGRGLRSDRTLHARANFHAAHVEEVASETPAAAEIALVIDDDPPRHANIFGWPPDKPEQKRIATEFASRSTLALP